MIFLKIFASDVTLPANVFRNIVSVNRRRNNNTRGDSDAVGLKLTCLWAYHK